MDIHNELPNRSYQSVYFDERWIGGSGIGRFAGTLLENFNFRSLSLPGLPSSPIDPIRLSFYMALKMPVDACLLLPAFNAPIYPCRNFILSIMDLNHIDRPENSSCLKRLYYRLILRRAARRAIKILTISEFSRQRIIDWAGLDPAKVVNVWCGVGPTYSESVVPLQLGYKYLLCVSNRKAHKNEVRLLEAMAKSGIDSEIRLVFTGDGSEELRVKCREYGIESRVSFLGKVTEEDMPSLYRGALALVFPSLYEGFGLPVVEAMACGTPVLTSSTTALPEVAGDAALLVDPTSVHDIAKGIHRICSDTYLRKELSRRGIVRASCFSWTSVVDRVKVVLDEALI